MSATPKEFADALKKTMDKAASTGGAKTPQDIDQLVQSSSQVEIAVQLIRIANSLEELVVIQLNKP